jgi:hypothetical protein
MNGQGNADSKARGITIPNFKLYYRAIVIKILCYWHKHRYEDQWKNRGPRYESTQLCSPNFRQRHQKHTMQKRQPFQQMLLRIEDICCRKLKLFPYFSPQTSVNSKWIENLYITGSKMATRVQNRKRELRDSKTMLRFWSYTWQK